METPETIRTSLQQRGVGYLYRFQDAFFHIPIQEQSRKYMRFYIPGRSYQTVHSSHGVYYHSKWGETDGHTQGYKDPPVPK